MNFPNSHPADLLSDLVHDFRITVIEGLGRERIDSAIRFASLLLGVVAILGLAHGAASSSTKGEGNAPQTPAYQLPSSEIQAQLDDIRDDMLTAINEWRISPHGTGRILFPQYERQVSAQDKAEYNALTGDLSPVADNVGMLQAWLPLEDANGYNFAEMFRTNPAYMAVVLDGKYQFIGIGTAYMNGKVHLVVQLQS